MGEKKRKKSLRRLLRTCKPGADQQKKKETETKWRRLLITYIIAIFFY